MRLRITLELLRETALPINYQHALASLVYRMLEDSNPEYARFLHDDGYVLQEGPNRRFKLFVYSGLIVPKSRRSIEGGRLIIAPGSVEWLLSSPVHDFLCHSTTGLLAAGACMEIDRHPFYLRAVESLPDPDFASPMRFSCLTSLVASRPDPVGPAYYLRPSDGKAFSEAVRSNLLQKHRLIHGEPPQDDRLKLTFDEQYLSRAPHGGTKKTTIKNGIDVIGVLAPFTLEGSTELMRVGYECGLGEKNSMGFGMAEVATAKGAERC